MRAGNIGADSRICVRHNRVWIRRFADDDDSSIIGDFSSVFSRADTRVGEWSSLHEETHPSLIAARLNLYFSFF